MENRKDKTNKRVTSRLLLILGIVMVMTIVSGCSNKPNSNGSSTPVAATTPTEVAASSDSPADTKELTKVTQVTNWFAEPEHGGQYAAVVKGFYEEGGMDMTIQSGGPQVSATQIVSSGQAMFGMTQADDLLLARKEGIPIVAIAALFQKSPQGLIYHANQDIKDFSDLDGRAVYTATAASYWEYIKAKYKFTNVQEMKYTGSLANFTADETSVTQGYITAEPFALKEQGIDTKILLNADSGYNPYNNMLFATEDTVRNHPELVKAYVEASIKGWYYYKDNYEEVNQYIQESNPDLTLPQMKFAADAQVDFVYGGDAADHGVGYMTEERWNELMDQLLELGLLTEKEDMNKIFTNEFLPSKE